VTDTEAGAVGDLVNGTGPDLAPSGGFLATADGTIDAVYAITTTAGAVAPKVQFSVTIVDEWPN